MNKNYILYYTDTRNKNSKGLTYEIRGVASKEAAKKKFIEEFPFGKYFAISETNNLGI
jgi:hypothetical protein